MIWSDNEDDGTGLTDLMSPFDLKMIADGAPMYKKAYGSFKFGMMKKFKGRWIYILIGGVVAIVLILYFTGYLNFGGA